MDDLLRSLAPFSAAAWTAIDDHARRVLRVNLAARQLVDFVGPLGWQHSAVNLGRVRELEPEAAPTVESAPSASVRPALRLVQPLVELRVPFELSRAELETVGRGAADPDLAPLTDAATKLARAEDAAVFRGFEHAGIAGITRRSPHPPLHIPQGYEAYPTVVADAVRILRMAGVDGPYAIALGPRCYSGLMQAMGRGGYPVLEVVRQVVGGEVVWAPAVDGAVVVSTRGGDFELTVGQDISIGYSDHDERVVHLYLLESFTFRVHTPEAGIWLTYQS